MVARRAHNPKVVGSNPASATKLWAITFVVAFFFARVKRPASVARWESSLTAAGGG